MQTKKLLVPVDLSSRSFDALIFAQQMAAELPVHVTLLNVVNLNVALPERRVYDEVFAQTQEALRKLAKFFFGDSPSVDVRVRLGRPDEEIIAEAKSEQAELIVMASPKSSGWRRLLGYGIVESIVRYAPCPTLVLPRVWKITPEQYREATRSADVAIVQPAFAKAGG